MSHDEALRLANEFVFRRAGVRAEPFSVCFGKRHGEGRAWGWSFMYGPEVLHPDLIARGDVIDGGEYFVRVDGRTGEASEDHAARPDG